MIALFHSVEEFMTELALDKLLVRREIVRVCVRYLHTTHYTIIQVVSTFSSGTDLVRLIHHVGEDVCETTQFAQLKTTAEQIANRVRAYAEELSLEVRHGEYLDPREPTH